MADASASSTASGLAHSLGQEEGQPVLPIDLTLWVTFEFGGVPNGIRTVLNDA